MEDWVGLYKFARLVVLVLVLGGIAFHLFRRRNKERLEAPARRMLEDDE